MTGRIPIRVVQGLQYGSEAKGAVTAFLALGGDPAWGRAHYAVRTGAVNAGHTVWHTDADGRDRAHKMQQLSTAWVGMPYTRLVIGPGAYIHVPTLLREVAWIAEALSMTEREVRNLILIDHRACLHLDSHQTEAKTHGRHFTIGATGKGCAEAIVDKITRRGQPDARTILFSEDRVSEDFRLIDTSALLTTEHHLGKAILIEGTQGTLLDLHLGPYPYTTSRMTSAANWLAECGLSPALPVEVVGVCRTYPIRVAGNSGPMPDETSWPALGQQILDQADGLGYRPDVKFTTEDLTAFNDALVAVASEMAVASEGLLPESSHLNPTRQHTWCEEDRLRYRVALSTLNGAALNRLTTTNPAASRRLLPFFELTTVTGKLRRIAALHLPTLAQAVWAEQPTFLALTFMNYLYPAPADMGNYICVDKWRRLVMARAKALEVAIGARLPVPGAVPPIRFLSVGPRSTSADVWAVS